MSRKVEIKRGILCWETKVQMCRLQLSFPAKHLQNALCDWVTQHDQLSDQVLWYKIHPLHLHKGVTCGFLLIGAAFLSSLRAYVLEELFSSKYYLDFNVEISTLFSKLFIIYIFFLNVVPLLPRIKSVSTASLLPLSGKNSGDRLISLS